MRGNFDWNNFPKIIQMKTLIKNTFTKIVSMPIHSIKYLFSSQ